MPEDISSHDRHLYSPEKSCYLNCPEGTISHCFIIIKSHDLMLCVHSNVTPTHNCITVKHLQNGFTPLHSACQEGHSAVVSVFLEHGADLHQTTNVSLLLKPVTSLSLRFRDIREGIVLGVLIQSPTFLILCLGMSTYNTHSLYTCKCV